jgi:hypothetical protein
MVDVNHSKYIKHLEHKVEELEDMVKGLKYKLAIAGETKHSKKELGQSYEWNEDDVSFSDVVISFYKEFLFPHYKFLGKRWTELNQQRGDSFSSMVMHNLVIPREMEYDDAWHRIITPMIAKKYADMRCNINNECQTVFMGKSAACSQYLHL